MSTVHRSIVCADIEGFGDPLRSDADRVVVRGGLYEALSKAFDGSAVPWDDCYREDRGDGALVLVSSEIPRKVLVTDLPILLAKELAAYNQECEWQARIRLRIAMNAGHIQYDEHGVVGSAINLTFRILNAEPFKQALACSSGLLALAVSNSFYAEVVRHERRSSPFSYRRARVLEKETKTDAWVCLPDRPFPDDADPATLPPLPTPRPVNDNWSPPRQLPADTAHFTGRDDELSRLLHLAADGRRPAGVAAISAIDGMAGIGKTALAVHAAHLLADRFDDGCLFLDLHGHTDSVDPVSPEDALERLLRALGVPGERIPHDVHERAALYRSRLAGTRTLIVLDNASGAEQVRPLLPGEAECLVLVTSRRRLISLDEALPISLDVLAPADGLAVLVAGASPRRIGADEIDAARRVVDLCGRLPLAVRIAAAHLRSRPAWTVTYLAGRLAEHRGALTVLNDRERDVAAAFALSYRALTPDQRRMFRRLGLHPGADADVHAAASLAGTTAEQARRLCEDLLDVHLLHQPALGRYRYHDLTRAFAAETVAAEESPDRCRAALTRLFDHYLGTAAAAMDVLYPAEKDRRPRVPAAETPGAPVDEPAAALAWLDAERPNLVAVCAHAAAHGLPEHATRLAATLFRYLDIGGHLTDAENLYGHARRAAAASGDRGGEAHLLTSLGGVHWYQGRYERADQIVQEALAIFEATGDRYGQARALSSLGIVHWRQGRYRRAADGNRRALALYREIGDLPGQARALGNLGLVRWRQGAYAEAVSALWEALARNRGLGDRRGEARMLGNLGNVHHHEGRYTQAADHHLRALALYREIGDRIGEADALTNLGLPVRRQGRPRRAADHHLRALALFHEHGDRNGQARALNGLGETLHDLGHDGRARVQHELALAIALETGDRYELARAHTGLAVIHLGAPASGHDRDHARHHARQALAIYTDLDVPEARDVQALLKGDHPTDTATEPP
ncbi:tetratricopeptide repeat protein [Actinomadura graeca]|uniref:Tetratricopeptide repeat protein n=1 Tax=Actinomadura graeca TaxID=2750812 RepID=A0ABX8R209_9ACTN|nr:tetratricopeptide repeat protein [Actinomadura graeca]QXJ25131.1 tetratricopeptide repeat protein [Actinomadura graeca]